MHRPVVLSVLIKIWHDSCFLCTLNKWKMSVSWKKMHRFQVFVCFIFKYHPLTFLPSVTFLGLNTTYFNTLYFYVTNILRGSTKLPKSCPEWITCSRVLEFLLTTLVSSLQLSLLRIPDDGDPEHPATLLELPGSSMTCPHGLCMYSTCRCFISVYSSTL